MDKIKLTHAIKSARQKEGVSQEEMAKEIGITRRHYQRLEVSGDFKMNQLNKILTRLDLQMLILPKSDMFVQLAGYIM